MMGGCTQLQPEYPTLHVGACSTKGVAVALQSLNMPPLISSQPPVPWGACSSTVACPALARLDLRANVPAHRQTVFSHGIWSLRTCVYVQGVPSVKRVATLPAEYDQRVDLTRASA